MSTERCVELLNNTAIQPEFSDIQVDKSSVGKWKRLKKFKYKNGIRRYFVRNDVFIGIVDQVGDSFSAMVRLPLQWERYMIEELRPDDESWDECYRKIYDDTDIDILADFDDEMQAYNEPNMYKFCVLPVNGDDNYLSLFLQPCLIMDDDVQFPDNINTLFSNSDNSSECEIEINDMSEKEIIDKMIKNGYHYDAKLKEFFS